jgi:signal transduction histidine kinase/ligand-binding sensor domain-containing protein
MNLKKAGYIMFLLLVITRIAQAQNAELKFHLIEGPNGKPLGKIRNITQDPRGYMWFAGEDLGSEQTALGCIYRYDGYKITAFRHDSKNPNSLGGVGVNTVFADNDGMIWVGMTDAGLDQFNPATGVFKHFPHDENDPGSVSGEVTPILKDRKGRLWVGTNNGLDLLDEKTGKFIHYRNDPQNPKSLSSNFVWNLYEDHAGVLWVATGFPWFNQNPEDGGLNRLEPDGTFTRFKHDPNDPHSLISNKVRAMFEDSQGVFWVGTSGDGLHTLDRKTGRFERHTYDPAKPEKLSRPPRNKTSEFAFVNDQVTFIQEDVVGSIWIGTMQSGLNRYDTLKKKITHYQSNNGFPDNSGWNAYQSRDGTLWITTEEANLYRVDPFRHPINHIDTDGSFGGGNGGTSSILEDQNGFLWVGTWGHGLLKYDQHKKRLHTFGHDPNDPTSLNDNSVYFIYQEQKDTLWIGTQHGLSFLDVSTEKFSQFHPTALFDAVDTSTVTYYLKDQKGFKWIATWGNGLFRYNPKTKDVKHYMPDPNNPGAIGTKDLLQIHEDKSGTLWFGSWNGGLNRLDAGSDKFRHYLDGYYILSFYEDSELFLVGTEKGLFRYNKSNDSFSIFQGTEELIVINGMMEDDEDNLWIATNSRLVKLNKKSNELFLYGTKFGISPNNLTPGPNMVKAKNGEILKGTFNGFHYFTPAELVLKPLPTQILISDFSINNLPVLTAENVSEITLSHDQNNFSFDFASDDYRTPHGVRYYTMLENYDKTWREAIGDKSASYFYVDPGNYVFKIMIYNNDGVRLIKEFGLHIDPPWWRTWWAYVLYVALIVFGIFSFIRFRTRSLQQEKIRLEEKVVVRTAELNTSLENLKATQNQLIQSEKMASLGELTAGIAHEIQNPLNFVNNFSEVSNELLDEMNEEIEKGNLNDVKALASDVKQNLEKVLHHGKRADAIVKGMLQHSRTSSGVKEPTDINALADEYLRLAYHGLRAKDKAFNATLHTDFDESLRPISIIPQDIGRVILNLITNAFYAVDEKKKKNPDFEPIVTVTTKRRGTPSADGGKIEIRVADNGNGIPSKVLDKIFQPFFTTKPTGQGTGLGLSLSYDIVKAHGGEIKVNTLSAEAAAQAGNENEGTEFTITLPA